MYNEKPWTLMDPVTGSTRKNKNSENSLRKKILDYLSDTGKGITIEQAVKIFDYSETSCRRVLRELKKSKLIKVTDVIKQDINLVGVYKISSSPDKELKLPKTGKSYQSVSRFLIDKKRLSVENIDLLKKELQKNEVPSKIAFAGNNRFTEAYPMTVLNKIWNSVKGRSSKSEDFLTKAAKTSNTKLLKETNTEELIKNYLSSNPYSLKSTAILQRALGGQVKAHDVKEALNTMIKNKQVDYVVSDEETERKDYLFQTHESPVWKLIKRRSSLESKDYLSLNDFSKKYLYKKNFSMWKKVNMMTKANTYSLGAVSRNCKYTELYEISKLKEVFRNFLKKERNQKSTQKSLFKFKLFGKEISLSIS